MTTLAETGAEKVEWDLRDLYEGRSDPRWKRDADEALGAAEAFRRRHAGRIATLEAGALVEATEEYERIVSLMFRVWLFAKLASDTDTTDPEYARLLQLAVERQPAVETELLFFRLEWAALDEENARAVLGNPRTQRYTQFLRAQRRFREHLLSEAEERVAVEKELGGVKAWERLNTTLLAAIRVRIEGEEMAPLAALQRLRVTPDRDTRRRIAEALSDALEQNIATRVSVLNAVATDPAVEDRLRGYPTWISYRNLENEVADADVDAEERPLAHERTPRRAGSRARRQCSAPRRQSGSSTR
jgi:oligoendopeptidase F